jgi:hypothetical protein
MRGHAVSPDDLRKLIRRTPFQPFRIYMASGHSYDVSSPEWMMVTGLTTALGIPGEAGDGDELMLLDNMSITHTEPIRPAKMTAQ